MSRIALVTQLTSLAEQCAALADGIGIRLDVLAPHSGGWQDAVLVLLGEDVTDPLPALSAPTVLIAVDHAAEVWQQAARLGTDTVAVLPAAAEWLTQRMIHAVEPPGSPATTIGVVAGSGGAGASVLACALARHAATEAVETVLLDADPLGGGVDLVLGYENIDGLRWPALTTSRGRLRPSTLPQALPRSEGLSVLSWDRETHADLSGDVFDAVITAAQQAFNLVIVDLPRHAPVEWASSCHHLVLVTPARVRAVIAASCVASRLRAVHPAVGLAVRAVDRQGLDPALVAESIGLELLGSYRDDPPLAAQVDRGEGIPYARTRLKRFAAGVLDGILTDSPHYASAGGR
ncbi:septum site-determining protein Ssd [Brevibacterium luteolum]|uniref:Rv3660c-like CheY-like N-terminal domain-containing protein n=1 Tax=Brevibacterium luteolum TaxID=199591 RepID=A0A849AMB0_9MICO|nr:septum site-determining protein Ssd [Brevibacterium luteolum]MBM7530555.1 secretion/DNA translocation related CpaE-like protein [Brevibacterium luteolum]NNG77949.1 hypothetical protein [Brevibacterium luteolum]